MTFRMTGIFQLLKRHGRNLKVIYPNTNSQYNPTTGGVFQAVPVEITVRGYFYDSKEENILETQVGEGNRRVVLYPFDTNGNPVPKPKDGDKIEGQRDKVVIYRTEEVLSNDQVLFYLCRVRE